MVIVTSTQPVKPLDGRKLQLVCSVKAVRTRAFLISDYQRKCSTWFWLSFTKTSIVAKLGPFLKIPDAVLF